jgi:hypothetical protein
MFRSNPQPLPTLDRRQALEACPQRLPVLRAAEAAPGELQLTLQFRRPQWQVLLGAKPICDRTFVLDALGREVYDACDGAAPVSEIVRGFAARHRVSLAEAELSVTQYLRMLIARGVVAMRIPQ